MNDLKRDSFLIKDHEKYFFVCNADLISRLLDYFCAYQY
jgi:hypothetical protein